MEYDKDFQWYKWFIVFLICKSENSSSSWLSHINLEIKAVCDWLLLNFFPVLIFSWQQLDPNPKFEF